MLDSVIVKPPILNKVNIVKQIGFNTPFDTFLENHPDIPKDIATRFRMQCLANKLNHNVSIEKYTESLKASLDKANGNWLELHASLPIPTKFNRETLVGGLYGFLYRIFLSELKDPLAAFKTTLIYETPVYSFLSTFISNVSLEDPKSLFEITDINLLNVAKEIAEKGECHIWTPLITKNFYPKVSLS